MESSLLVIGIRIGCSRREEWVTIWVNFLLLLAGMCSRRHIEIRCDVATRLNIISRYSDTEIRFFFM